MFEVNESRLKVTTKTVFSFDVVQIMSDDNDSDLEQLQNESIARSDSVVDCFTDPFPHTEPGVTESQASHLNLPATSGVEIQPAVFGTPARKRKERSDEFDRKRPAQSYQPWSTERSSGYTRYAESFEQSAVAQHAPLVEPATGTLQHNTSYSQEPESYAYESSYYTPTGPHYWPSTYPYQGSYGLPHSDHVAPPPGEYDYVSPHYTYSVPQYAMPHQDVSPPYQGMAHVEPSSIQEPWEDISAGRPEVSLEGLPFQPTDQEWANEHTERARSALRKWYLRFNQLYEYKRENGDCNVPQKFKFNKELGIWVNKQRENAKKFHSGKRTSMTQEKMGLLDSIGFRWSKPRGAGLWDERFEELKTFYQQHGHSRVPTKYSENTSLGRWVTEQRREYKLVREGLKSQLLTPERITKLDHIGFHWELSERGDRDYPP